MLQKEGPEGRLFLKCPHCGQECANKTVLGSHIAKMHAQTTRPTFDRLVHSVGGRPRCSGCKELFSSWDRLRKHIEHGACQFPVRESERKHCEPETVKTEDEEISLPAAHHPDVHSIVQQGGWQALVKNMTWRKQLAQWCCLCGTWCASCRAVKMHLARTHKVEWNPHKTRIEMLCKSQQADITTPCSYCGSTSKEPKSHVVACPVIFQSIFIDLIRHGSCGGGKLLPAPTAGGKPEQCPAERSNDWSGRRGGNRQETSDGRGRQGLRKRQAQAKAAQGAGARRLQTSSD